MIAPLWAMASLCLAISPPQPGSLSAAELFEWLGQADGPRLFDVRTEAEYRREHLPGAQLLPFGPEVQSFLAGLGENRAALLVFYCNGPG
jgi:rhodanese-related sulfurtransferase